jgi:hypothetical protein
MSQMQGWSQPGRTPQEIAPPPSAMVRVPSGIPDKFRAPGMPPCWVSLMTDGADVKVSFDPGEVIESLLSNLGKQLRKRFDVNVGPAQAGTPAIVIRLLQMDEGNRFLRYFLTLFAGATRLTIDGYVLDRMGQGIPFNLEHRCRAGIFGGSGNGLLKTSAAVLAGKIAKMVTKAWK